MVNIADWRPCDPDPKPPLDCAPASPPDPSSNPPSDPSSPPNPSDPSPSPPPYEVPPPGSGPPPFPSLGLHVDFRRKSTGRNSFCTSPWREASNWLSTMAHQQELAGAANARRRCLHLTGSTRTFQRDNRISAMH